MAFLTVLGTDGTAMIDDGFLKLVLPFPEPHFKGSLFTAELISIEELNSTSFWISSRIWWVQAIDTPRQQNHQLVFSTYTSISSQMIEKTRKVCNLDNDHVFAKISLHWPRTSTKWEFWPWIPHYMWNTAVLLAQNFGKKVILVIHGNWRIRNLQSTVPRSRRNILILDILKRVTFISIGMQLRGHGVQHCQTWSKSNQQNRTLPQVDLVPEDQVSIQQ